MNRSLFITFFLLAASSVLPAQTPPCFASFANVAPGEAPRLELISDTHKDLLEKLGGNKLSQETLAKILAVGDPFLIPDQDGTVIDVLQKRMKDFHEMLKTKGWDTAEVRAHLLSDFSKRAADSDRASEKIHDAVIKSVAEQTLDWPGEGSPHFSPDGNLVLFTVATPFQQNPHRSPVVLYDLKTKKKLETSTGIGSFQSGTFSKDGTSLLFGDVGNVIQMVPLTGGTPDFTKAKTLGARETGSHSSWKIEKMEQGADHQRIYGDFDQSHKRPFLFNATSGTRTPIKIDALLDPTGRKKENPDSINEWGVMPGTNDLYFLVWEKSGVRMHVVAVDTKGNCTTIEKSRFWRFDNPAHGSQLAAVKFAADHKTIVGSSGGGSITIVAGGSTEPRLANLPGLHDKPDSQLCLGFDVHPTKNEAAVLIADDATQMKRIDIVNLDSGNRTGGITVPPDFDIGTIQFSPDGGKLLATEVGATKSINLNYEARLAP